MPETSLIERRRSAAEPTQIEPGSQERIGPTRYTGTRLVLTALVCLLATLLVCPGLWTGVQCDDVARVVPFNVQHGWLHESRLMSLYFICYFGMLSNKKR